MNAVGSGGHRDVDPVVDDDTGARAAHRGHAARHQRGERAALEIALGPVWIVVLAGLAGFLAGQSLNSFVVTRMKRRMGERGLIARLFTSSGLGELVDTIIFCSIASVAIGITTFEQWAEYTILGVLYKVIVQYAMIPVTSAVIRWMKRTDPSYQARLAALEADLLADADDDTTLVIGRWSYAGAGWDTDAETELALSAAARAREYAQHAAAEKRTPTNG